MLDDLVNGIADRRHDDHSRFERGYDRYRDERYGHHHPLVDLALRVLRNKVILTGIVIAVLIFGALGIWMIVTLMPYLGQLIHAGAKMLEQQGIRGILETIMPFLQKILEGSGK